MCVIRKQIIRKINEPRHITALIEIVGALVSEKEEQCMGACKWHINERANKTRTAIMAENGKSEAEATQRMKQSTETHFIIFIYLEKYIYFPISEYWVMPSFLEYLHLYIAESISIISH